jgi:hypothetical protein
MGLPPDDFFLDDLEHQMKDHLDTLGEHDRQMEKVMDPWEVEDPISRQLSMLEAHIENSVVKPPLIRGDQKDPVPLPLSEPIRGLRSPDPPIVAESTWRGIKEPEPSIFGRIRSSRGGAMRSPNREDDERYCWKEHEFIKEDVCKECEYWDNDIEICGYWEQQSQEE